MAASREEAYREFVVDYNNGVGREDLCAKYKIDPKRFDECLAFLAQKGHKLKEKDLLNSEAVLNDEDCKTFVAGYNNGVNKDVLCSKFHIDINSFNEFVDILKQRGFSLIEPVKVDLGLSYNKTVPQPSETKSSINHNTVSTPTRTSGAPLSFVLICYGAILYGAYFLIQGINFLMKAMFIVNMMPGNMQFVVYLVCIVIPLLFLISGTFLLKLRSWARYMLEYLLWFHLLFMVYLVIVGISHGNGMLSNVPSPLFYNVAVSYYWLIGKIVIYAVIIFIIIKILRRSSVREAVSM